MWQRVNRIELAELLEKLGPVPGWTPDPVPETAEAAAIDTKGVYDVLEAYDKIPTDNTKKGEAVYLVELMTMVIKALPPCFGENGNIGVAVRMVGSVVSILNHHGYVAFDPGTLALHFGAPI